MTTEQVNPLATRYALTQSDEWQTARNPPVEITDEMVERAWIAYRDELGPEERVRMRAALEAALNGGEA